MIDSPFFQTKNGVFSIEEERIDRSSGECRIIYSSIFFSDLKLSPENQQKL